MIDIQIQLFLIFLIDGLIIGLIFDFFRILRKAIKTSDLLTYIEDALFWILTGLLILYSIFVYNNGEIRIFMFIAIIIGMVIYFSFISKLIIKANLTIINFLKKIFMALYNIIKIPFNIIYKLIKKIVIKPIIFIILNIREHFTKIAKKTINLVKTTKISSKIAKNTKN